MDILELFWFPSCWSYFGSQVAFNLGLFVLALLTSMLLLLERFVQLISLWNSAQKQEFGPTTKAITHTKLFSYDPFGMLCAAVVCISECLGTLCHGVRKRFHTGTRLLRNKRRYLFVFAIFALLGLRS